MPGGTVTNSTLASSGPVNESSYLAFKVDRKLLVTG